MEYAAPVGASAIDDSKGNLVLSRRIPAIDFSCHPAYGKLYGQPSISDRLSALAAVAPKLARFVALEICQAIRRVASANSRHSVNPIFQSRGICVERLNPTAKQAIMDGLSKPLATLVQRLENIAPAARAYEDAQLVVDRSEARSAYKTLDSELDRLGVLELARRHVKGSKGAVKYMVLQINDAGESHWRGHFSDVGIPDSVANYLHVDTGVGVLKTIIYLSDVGPKNGVFSYVVGSHGIRRSLADRVIRSAIDHSGIGTSQPESRRSFNALPRFLQRKADFGKDIFEITNDIRGFMENEMSVTSDMGDVLIFDNMGAHRGGMVEEGRRIIIQVLIH